jgi:hypothetical protein
MRRPTLQEAHDAIEETGYALRLALVGVALLAGRMVDVVRSPANVAVGVGFLVAAGLLLLDACGRLAARWSHVGWIVLILVTAAFIGVNFF